MLEIDLLGADLGVKAHRALVDGDLLARLDQIKAACFALDLRADIIELIALAQNACEIVA